MDFGVEQEPCAVLCGEKKEQASSSHKIDPAA